MSYLDAYINLAGTFGWQGGPSFSTRVTTLANGREVRESMWARVRHSFTVPFENLEVAQYREVKRMHLVCRGMAHGFRFRDELDYQAQNEVFGYGDGAATAFQLCKISAIDGLEYQRDCFAIVSAAVTVNGVAAAAAVDLRRGRVTFAAPPANDAVLRWTGEFDVWVRFNQDDLPFSLANLDACTGTIELIELPPPAVGED